MQRVNKTGRYVVTKMLAGRTPTTVETVSPGSKHAAVRAGQMTRIFRRWDRTLDASEAAADRVLSKLG